MKLAIRQARFEEQMKTLEANLAAKLEGFEKRMAERDVRMADRDRANTRWLVAFSVGLVVILGGLQLL